MRYLYFTLVAMMALILSCTKHTHVRINGVVAYQSVDCTSPTGFPYIIKYAGINSQIDSFITATLPTAFKIAGTKISFEIRNVNATYEYLICNTSISIPKQQIIFNVLLQ